MADEGCPLSQLVGETKKGYCGDCAQRYDCVFVKVWNLLEDLEQRIIDIQSRVR